MKMVKRISSTQNGMFQCAEQIALKPDPIEEMRIVNLIPAVKGQTVRGFGGALTESAAYNYCALSQNKRKAFIKALFDPDEGNGYTLCRTHIHSADFSVGEYTYVDENDETLQSFTLKPDEKYVQPLVLDALKAAKGRLCLFASPWSPPAWMKENHDFCHGGALKKEHYALWGRYMAKYVSEYKKLGVNFFAVTVQNEALAAQTWESCQYSATQEAAFAVEALRPALDAAGLAEVKIFIWDHNKEHLFDRAAESFAVPGAQTAIDGVAFHWYSGDHFDAIDLAAKAFPNKEMMLTEYCCGLNHDAAKGDSVLWTHAMHYAHEMLGDLAHGATACVDWNVCLDLEGGPYHNRTGGCTAAILVDAKNNTFTLTPIYAAMGHFSRYIQPGAVKIGSTCYTQDVEHVAFANPDGSIAVVLVNNAEKEMPVNLKIEGCIAPLALPPESISTVLLQ